MYYEVEAKAWGTWGFPDCWVSGMFRVQSSLRNLLGREITSLRPDTEVPYYLPRKSIYRIFGLSGVDLPTNDTLLYCNVVFLSPLLLRLEPTPRIQSRKIKSNHQNTRLDRLCTRTRVADTWTSQPAVPMRWVRTFSLR